MNAGWYPDPQVAGQQRYWDGLQWTPQVHPMQQLAVPAYAPMTPLYAGQYPVAAKNPAVSLLISFFIPGVGSMINGDVGIGVGILVGYLVSCVLIIVFVGIIGVFAFWIWGMIDAYTGAQRFNARHGIVS